MTNKPKPYPCLSPTFFEVMRPGMSAWFGREELKKMGLTTQEIANLYGKEEK